MFDKIISFVTPGPMTEIFGFRARVFYSWISLGVLLTLIGTIIALIAGYPINVGALIAMPIVVCLFGLFGLGIDSLQGRNSEYPGWYWLLFPILSYLVIGFWFSLALIGFGLALAGVRLPQLPKIVRQPKFSKIDPQKFRQQTENLKLGDFLKDFKNELEQLKLLEQEYRLEPDQEKIVRKLREFDSTKYNDRLKHLFKEDELEELILLLLILLGVEVK
jgi:hypothetical protein